MTSTPSPYQTMVTPRSRRLRTTGLVLLVAAVTMALYGFFVLMPSLKRTVAAQNGTGVSFVRRTPVATAGDLHAQARLRRAYRVAAAKVLFAYGYWTVCSLLVIAMVFVAWLDLREVSRTYLNQRRAIWTETASNLEAEQRRNKG